MKTGRHVDMSKRIGKTYNDLSVIGLITRYKNYKNKKVKSTFFKCRCICGKIKIILAGNVCSGGIKSCGCKRRERINKGIRQYNKKKFPYSPEKKRYSGYKVDAKRKK